MKNKIIELNNLIKNVKTYPSWTTGRVTFLLTKEFGTNDITVFYRTAGPVKRTIQRTFPRTVELTPRFVWTLGFLKGEGSNSLGKSNYRRFTITNTNPALS